MVKYLLAGIVLTCVALCFVVPAALGQNDKKAVPAKDAEPAAEKIDLKKLTDGFKKELEQVKTAAEASAKLLKDELEKKNKEAKDALVKEQKTKAEAENLKKELEIAKEVAKTKEASLKLLKEALQKVQDDTSSLEAQVKALVAKKQNDFAKAAEKASLEEARMASPLNKEIKRQKDLAQAQFELGLIRHQRNRSKALAERYDSLVSQTKDMKKLAQIDQALQEIEATYQKWVANQRSAFQSDQALQDLEMRAQARITELTEQ